MPRGDRAETICGSSNSSVIALPSAIRSGQNATSIDTPRPTIIFSTRAVTPGKTVDRRISSWPSRRYGAQPPSAFGIAVWSGFRCSSTGVPMTTTTCSAEPTIDGSAEAWSRPSATTRSSTSARAGLVERQLAGVHRGDGGLAHVVDAHPGAAVGERDRQRQADVAAPADDDHVTVELAAAGDPAIAVYLRMLVNAARAATLSRSGTYRAPTYRADHCAFLRRSSQQPAGVIRVLLIPGPARQMRVGRCTNAQPVQRPIAAVTGATQSVAAYQSVAMYFVSVYSSSPSWAPSRPMPDCLTPPNGAAGSETRPRFSPIMPASSASDTRSPRRRSRV